MGLFQRILDRLSSQAPVSPRVHMALFGKHPGWDDHIEDWGLETAPLVQLKRALYTEGIAGNIDSGRWERLDASQRLEGFDHLLVWRLACTHAGGAAGHAGDWMAGRIWSSVDGKGRALYPMVACCHCAGLSIEWVLEHALPALEAVRQGCLRTRLAAEVLALGQAQRERLRLEAACNGIPANDQPPSEPAAGPIQGRSPGAGLDESLVHGREGLERVLYQLSPACRGTQVTSEPRVLVRLPAAMAVPTADPVRASLEAMRRWLEWLSRLLDPRLPLLMVTPTGEAWIDLVAGCQPSGLFDGAEGGVTPQAVVFAMRARPSAIPPASEIPYALDEVFLTWARGILEPN